MAENLNLNVNIDTKSAEGSVGSLKRQLREAQAEVMTLSEKFGATSEQAVNAAKKAAELRDKIGDAKALTDAFNPDAKFKSLTASLSGVAGGFGAVQGAMALFGKESEDVTKTLLKVQSAMAISQGLQSVGESIDSFKQLGAVIRTQAVGAFNSLKAAIGATGIGLLVIALGTIVTYFDDIKAAIQRAFPSLADFGNKVKDIVQTITDWIGITSEQERQQERIKKYVEAATDAIDGQIALLQTQEHKEAEIYKLKKQRIETQMMLVKGATDEEIKQKAKLNNELQVLDLQEAARLKKKAEDDAKAQLEKEKNAREFTRRIAQISIDAISDEVTKSKEARMEKLDNDLRDMYTDTEFKKQGIEGQNQIIADLKRAAQIDLDKIDSDAKKAAEEKQKAYDNELLNAEVAFRNAKADIAHSGLALLAEVVGQGTAVGKAAALADIAIGTGVGFINGLEIAQKSAKGTGPAAAFAFPIFYATQIAAVLGAASRAKSVLNAGTSGSSMTGSISAPNISTAAPITPQVPIAPTTNLSQQTINDIGNQAVRAYVVESDVTSSQQRIESIRQRARFS